MRKKFEQQEINTEYMIGTLRSLWAQQNRLESRSKDYHEELIGFGYNTSVYTPAINDLIRLVIEYSSPEYSKIKKRFKGKNKDEIREELRKTQDTDVSTLVFGEEATIEYAKMQGVVLLAIENEEHKSFVLDFLSLDKESQEDLIRQITDNEADFFKESEILPPTFSIQNITRAIRERLNKK